jgi:hypothetical protein
MRFTVEEYVSYILQHFPMESYKELDVDRIDNDRHYEPGNIRLVPRKINLANKRSTIYIIYKEMKIPASHLWHVLKAENPEFMLAKKTVARLVKEGLSWEQIRDYKRRPAGRPSTTSLMPDPDIVSLYLGK